MPQMIMHVFIARQNYRQSDSIVLPLTRFSSMHWRSY